MVLFKEFIQLFLDFYFYLFGPELTIEGKLNPPQIVAHRGWHNNENLIENTMQSFQTALDNKLYGIEFDVRWTKDNIPIIHHDRDLGRLWGIDRKITDLNFFELRKLAPMIPTLEEVVSSFGKKIHLFIEIKNEPFNAIDIQKKTLAKILNGLNEGQDFHFLTLNLNVVNLFNNFSPSLFIYVSEFGIKEMINIVDRNKLGGMSGHYALISNDSIRLHSNKLIGTGFIRTKKSLNRERNRNVAYHFTNHPWNLV